MALFPLLILAFSGCGKSASQADGALEEQFTRLMVVGKSQYDSGDNEAAIQSFTEAVALFPNHEDALQNLANACLRARRLPEAIAHAQALLALNSGSAPAYYVIGCAQLRQQNFTEALKALQTAEDVAPLGGNPAELNAVAYQIGLAHFGLQQWDDAIARFEEITAFEPEHPAAWYNLSQALLRVGLNEDAQDMAEQHQEIMAQNPSFISDEASLEKCRHTEARVPFKLAQPDSQGIAPQFVDATEAAFGADADVFQAPLAILDVNHRGQNDLFVRDLENRFRMLINSNGVFQARDEFHPGHTNGRYFKAVVGDVQNDGYEDVVVLGEPTIHLFRFATNGVFSEQTAFTGLKGVAGVDGLLADFNSDGSLDLTVVQTNRTVVKIYENLGPPYFVDKSATSGLPASMPLVAAVEYDDWNGDDLMDLFVGHASQPPSLLMKQRGGPLAPTNAPAAWSPGSLIAVGDMNNNLRVDMVVARDDQIHCHYSRLEPKDVALDLKGFKPSGLRLTDYDNDGWLDILATGDGLRLWRNRGEQGFADVTDDAGLSGFVGGIEDIRVADFDGDCDVDLVIALTDGGLRFLRNQGGNANRMLKIRLDGQRSNKSGLGVKLLATAGQWRTSHTIKRLPVEIGVGSHDLVDSLDIRWFDASDPQNQLDTSSCTQWSIVEITLPTGSCPYLYRWDGEGFEFVTDLLGAAPLGLPATQSFYIEADTEEYVWIGDESMLRPRDGHYVLQVTEELREVLYLDQAQLVVVDHPAGTEAHTTSKLVPRKPFPRHEIITLENERPLVNAVNSRGEDVTEALRAVDRNMAGPAPEQLRIPQLRGLAEPHSVELDFGELDVQRELVLVLNGWLRFGGGMANIAGSLNPELPFPFPTLEVESSQSGWQKVDVELGTPAGKTKTIVADLSGKLPPGSQRLRIRTAYELYWDRIVLLERSPAPGRLTRFDPVRADLHWRGFSEFKDLPADQPLTPDYERVNPAPSWTITPMGWCTRYGDVRELLDQTDNALVLLNGGDELTLEFAAAPLPDLPDGWKRDFFFYNVGWDKDADFHVAAGWTVDPLPWHGMDYQAYGSQPRPETLDDSWIGKFNTRWIGQTTFPKRVAVGHPGAAQ